MVNPEIKQFLDVLTKKMVVELPDAFDKSTTLYNGAYNYSLTHYRTILNNIISKYKSRLTLQSTSQYEIINALSSDIIDEYLIEKMHTEYHSAITARIQEIANIPIVEQKSPEWFRLREGMISASDAGYFLKKCGVARAVDALKIKVGLKNYTNSLAPPLMHGNTYEDVSRAIYESRNQVVVSEYGILSSPTPYIGASPDGVITKCLHPSWQCQSRLGRLLEIKNPYSREIDHSIKPEYMVQILQQQYTTQLPVCDFVETTIVDKYCRNERSNYKAYETMDDLLNDKIDTSRSNWRERINNSNIPVENLNKFGNEKGFIIWYQLVITENDIRNKYVLYPLNNPYEKMAMEKWIVDTNSDLFSIGYTFREIKYWRLDVYDEKTVVYDQRIYEGEYIPRLCNVWDVIVKCRKIKEKSIINKSITTANTVNTLEVYIDDLENKKDSPFYNENKVKKKIKTTASTSLNNSNIILSHIPMKNNDGVKIELDF